MSLTLDYLKIYEEHIQLYPGANVIILMQIGDFFECFSTNTRGPNLEEISQLLNVRLTRRDKSITTIDEKNPKMMGFPCISLQKNLKILIDNNYTVVVIEQIPNLKNPKIPKREITGVYSPSTYVEETKSDNTYLLVLNIQSEKQKDSKDLICIGFTAIDLNIGKVYTDEILSSLLNDGIAYLKCQEIISKFQPKEIIIYCPVVEVISIFEEKVDLYKYNYRYIKEIDKAFHKISYQSQFLKKVYKNQESEMIDIIELLDLERKSYATLSLVLALDFVYRQNETLLREISKPLSFEKDNLFLGNNTIFNLNLLSNKNKDDKNKFSCLFDVVNLTNTMMGRRLLKERLLSPETNINIIQSRYQEAKKILLNENFEEISKELKNIRDLQRYLRRIVCKTLHPFEFCALYFSIKSACNIFTFINLKISENIQDLISQIEKKFILEKLEKNLREITESFYHPGIHPEIDQLLTQMEVGEDCVDLLINTLNGICKEDLKFTVKINKKEGQFLILTKKRGDKLQETLKAWDKIEINDNIQIRAEDLEFSNTKSQTKIRVPNLGKKHIDPNLLQVLLNNKIREKYFSDLEEIREKYLLDLERLTTQIAEIDFNYSNASLSKKYNYICPCIKDDNDNQSFISFENLRHPIIERLIDYEYIPQSFEIGKSTKGMLLYGLNSSGKSSFQKSVGLSLILAQAGLFVPATSFCYYPYRYLFTRIDGNDNLFKGLSSFTLEMMDLKNILKYKGYSTLIIGDEVCKGTEYLSANSILASTILTLSQSDTSFIFATHLHDIPKIKQIKELKNIGVYHLDVVYLPSTNELIFERKLKEGQGEEIYGILVASNIIQDNQFIELTNSIKNEMKDLPNHYLSTKMSRYNKNLFMDECELCKVRTKDGSNFETHHLLFQKDCKDGFSIEKPNIPMNSKMNLIVLCEECHHKIHSNEKVINTFKQTNKGKKLSFTSIP